MSTVRFLTRGELVGHDAFIIISFVWVFEALVPGFAESFRDSLASNQMGYIIVVSAPVILFILIVALAFSLLGRETGRRQSSTAPQYFGPPVPPPQEKAAGV